MKKAYLLLGRNGDLVNLLPVLEHEAQLTGSPTPLVVARDYAPLLDGVSYVEPTIFEGDFFEVPLAKHWAQRKLSGFELIDCSVYGRGVNAPNEMTSFNRELWKRSRTTMNFDHARVTFDRRDAARERELLIPYGGAPFILFAGAGTSSPFAQRAEYVEAVRAALPAPFQLVDISDLRSHRPYDLLALYEKASGLIAIDSFPLHLALATPDLPVVALICDGPTEWHRSAWRPNHVSRRLYSEALAHVQTDLQRLTKPSTRQLTFVTTRPDKLDVQAHARYVRADAGRAAEMLHKPWHSFAFAPARTAKDIGESAPLPFVRDLAMFAVSSCRVADDIIVIGNSDIGFVEGMTGRLVETVDRFGCTFAHRWDFNSVAITTRLPRGEDDLKQARWYAGSDLFAFTAEWWMKHGQPDFPDMVWGREGWDLILRNMMKRAAGAECELQRAIWHERHASPWEQNKRLPGNEHNRRLAAQWIARFGGDWNDWQNKPVYRG